MPAAPSARWTRRQWLLLLVACLGQFLTQLDLTAVNVAVGAVRAGLGASLTLLTWVVDGYLVTFAAFMPGLGALADLLGRRRVFLAGLAAFAACSAWCATAPDAAWLVAARAAQGAAGAAVLVSSLALLVHGFAGAERTRAIGWWASVAGTALIAGPVAGGLLVDAFGWRSIFWLNVPVALAGAAAAALTVTESRGAALRIDWPGQFLAVAALAAVAFGLQTVTEFPGTGWTALAAGAVAAAAFVLAERRATAPLVPVHVLRSRQLRAAGAAAALINFSTLGLLYLLSLYFEQVAGEPAAGAGWRIAPLFAAYVMTTPWAGRVHRRFGDRGPAFAGGVAAAAGALAVPALFHHPAWIAGALALSGAGVGLAMPAVVSAAVAAVPSGHGGLASGLTNTARQIGNTLGVALLGGIVTAAAPLTAGVRDALLAAAAGYLLAAALAVALGSRSPAPAPRSQPGRKLPADRDGAAAPSPRRRAG